MYLSHFKRVKNFLKANHMQNNPLEEKGHWLGTTEFKRSAKQEVKDTQK